MSLNLEKFLIPLEEINQATKNFSSETLIGVGGFGMVYRGQLSERYQNRTAAIKRLVQKAYPKKDEFLHELNMISRFNHQNIIPFLGYCDEGNEMIIVFEYAINGSLDLLLDDPNKIGCISWSQRLKICLGAATGLNYLHSGLRKNKTVIHRDVKSANILLDVNMEAKIGDFGLSRLSPRNRPNIQHYTKAAGTPFYLDPIYLASDILRKDTDVYSFGVVMFEMLSGMPAYLAKTFGDGQQQYLINRVHFLVHRYSADSLVELIDPNMMHHIDIHSSNIFTEIAYQCISFEVENRPTMDMIIKSIKDALNIQEQKDVSAKTNKVTNIQKTINLSWLKLELFLIPLEEINRATKNFSSETQIGGGVFGMVYKGLLSERWVNRTAIIKRLGQKTYQEKDGFLQELNMIFRFHHENIIPFLGYCNEGNEMIMVFEYALNGSLDLHFEDPRKSRCITWAQRLKICLGAARGLSHLHSGLGEDNRVIHRDVKSRNILLDDNMEAKICDFGLSRPGLRNKTNSQVYTKAAGTDFYLDPIYRESGILLKESDMYSFGVVLFEMLSGTLAYQQRSSGDGEERYLISRVRQLVHLYSVNGLNKLIDPNLIDHIDTRSSDIFKEIAYQCISLELWKRPTMDMIIKSIKDALNIQEQKDASTITIQSHRYQKIMSSSGLNLEKFLIPLEEINRATNNFSSETQVGDGGFCKVYRGQLSENWQNRMASIKRVVRNKDGKGEEEFCNELKIISTFHPQNINCFIGYCIEANELIIVSEYPSNGSLSHHLRDANKSRCITWAQRLKICLGAATGLNYLHSGGDDNIVIHRDPNSSNILLDDSLEAKVCDFGYSIVCPRNQPHTQVYTKVVGTLSYMDPVYKESGILQKESDVYTFGLVLFEMLSGMLVDQTISFGDGKPSESLINLIRRLYHDDGLETLIDPHIRDHIVIRSFDTFKEIAYQCISYNLKERPTMEKIIKRIKKALTIQETGPALIECLKKDIGFSEGKPVAAFTIYKCLLHWKSFENERTTVFDRLIYMFDLAMEKEDTNGYMAYWLSNVWDLLFLIQGRIKTDDASSMGRHSSLSSVGISETAAAIEVVQAVAKHTAFSFKQKLTEYVEYTYDIIRDNLIKELASLLSLCIQVPRTPRRRVLRPGKSFGKDSEPNHWQGIVDCLNALLITMKENFVPPVIVGKIFTQVFSYINVRLFHSILLYREYCTFSNGEYVEAGLKQLQQWCLQAKEKHVSSAMEKLMHLRQAVTLLVTMNEKYSRKSFVEISEDICPGLSLQQLYRICSLYRDEKNEIPSVTQLVILTIEMRRTKDIMNEDIKSFIVEDYSSEPFAVGDLFTSAQVEDVADVKPPAELAKYSALRFLFD